MRRPNFLARPLSPSEELLLSMSKPDVLCIGYADADLTPVEVPADQSILITGTSGSGKSTCLRMCAKQEAMKTNTVLIALDPHSMVSALGNRLTAYWSSQQERVEGIRKLHALLDRRLTAIRQADMAGTFVDNSSWNITMGPRIVLLIDEIADLMAWLIRIDKRNERRPDWDSLVDMMARIVAEGRKAGFLVIATTTKFTNALTQDPRITIGLPTGIMYKPDDPAHARLGLKIDDQKSPETDPSKWIRRGHGATFGAQTRTIKNGLIRFQTPWVKAIDLREAADKALRLGVRVRNENDLFEPYGRTY